MNRDVSNSARLTKRQSMILQRISEGKSTARIAAELCVSERTVSWHLNRIYRVLEVRGRQEAMLSGQRLGLVALDDESITRGKNSDSPHQPT